MLSSVSQPQNLDLQSSPDPKHKENPEIIISILAKSPKERQLDDLKRLANFLQRSTPFLNFWNSVPQGIHQNLLRGIRYSDIKPNKPVFIKGEPAKGLYFILKGSISAFTTSKHGEHLNIGSLNIPTTIKNRLSTPNKMSLPSSLSNLDCPASGIENNDPKSTFILEQNPHCEFSALLGEDDCFGELVSDIYNPKSSVLITKETCHFAVLSLSYYKKTLNDYNKTTHRENIEFARNISLIQGWSSSDLTDLLKHSKTWSFSRNHVFYDIGDPCEFVYLIHEGEVEITKETKLNIEDEEIFDKASIAKHSQDVDRARLAGLNPMWKKKFSMAKRQQTRVALLGSCQSFGEEEVINQIHARSSKAVVKSLTAKVLIVPVERILKTSLSEPTTQTHARSSSITQLPLNLVNQEKEKPGEGEFSKYVQAYNQDSQREPLSSRPKRSSSYSNIGQQSMRKVLGETNTIWNKQAFTGTKNMELPSVQSTIELKENINNVTKTRTPTVKSPRGDIIISSKENIKIGGINRLWESNRHAYFSKSKKVMEQSKMTTTTQGESLLIRQKSSASFLPDTSRTIKKPVSSRHLEKPVIINNFAIVAKRQMGLNTCDQAGLSMNGQTPSSRSKEVEDDSQADTKLTSKLNISRLPIGKIRGSSCDTKTSTASHFYIKKLGKVITAANSFREHSTGPVKLDDGWNRPEVLRIKLSNIKSPVNSNRDTATDRYPKMKSARNSLTIMNVNQFIS